MSRLPRPGRSRFVALGLSAMLLADVLTFGPGTATLAADGDPSVPAAGDTAPIICAAGFDRVDSRSNMSLHGVTLTRDGALAVGYAKRGLGDDEGRRRPASMIARSSGWSRLRTVGPGREDGLMAVESRRSDTAWGVGFTTIQGRVMPLAMRWNGRRWWVDRPKPTGALTALFTDVTIVGDGSPFAVGYRMTASGRRQPLVIRRDGKRWRSLPIRTGKRESVSLTGVAPDRRGGTWVVGHGGPAAEIHPLIFRREDGRWDRMKLPPLAGEAVLDDVVAVGGDDGWAVGYQRVDGRSLPLVLHWNGRAWSRAPAPSFDSHDVVLRAVSVAPEGGVWIVGAAWNADIRSHEAVAAWWDGQAWNEISGRAGGSELYDVVGSLGADGWAVGRSDDAARATRVCTPAQSGVFGGVAPSQPFEPGPDADLAAGGSGGAPGGGPDDGAEAVEDEATVVEDAATVVAGDDSSAADGTEPEATEQAAAEAAEAAEATAAAVAAAGAAETTVLAARKKGKTRKQAAANRRKQAAARKKSGRRIGSLPAATRDRVIYAAAVGAAANVREETATFGAVVADFDGDGTDDLFIGRHGRKGRLVLNEGGVFKDNRAFKTGPLDRHGCAAADIDGSGLPDLYCTVGGKRGSGLKANELWLDPGGPAPEEVGVERGISDPAGRGRFSAFLEAGPAGDISLAVANSPMRVDGLPSVGRLYRTEGDGSFVTRPRPGFAPSLGAIAMRDADFDADGREDLLLVVGGPQSPVFTGTLLYRNTPRGLVDVTRRMGIRSIGEVDAELVDLNRDGRLDLVQLSPTRLRVSKLKGGKYRRVYERRLDHGRAVAGGDVNGDGKGDLYIVRSNAARNTADVVLVNRDAGSKWSSLKIPQIRSGDGDDAFAIDHDGNGLDDFLVLNGKHRRGPVELIAFFER